MKTHTIKLKQDNMICHKCVLNVIKTLSQLNGIIEIDVDLDSHSIKLKINRSDISGKDKAGYAASRLCRYLRFDSKVYCTRCTICKAGSLSVRMYL